MPEKGEMHSLWIAHIQDVFMKVFNLISLVPSFYLSPYKALQIGNYYELRSQENKLKKTIAIYSL